MAHRGHIALIDVAGCVHETFANNSVQLQWPTILFPGLYCYTAIPILSFCSVNDWADLPVAASFSPIFDLPIAHQAATTSLRKLSVAFFTDLAYDTA